MQIQCQIQSRHKGSATVSQHPPGEGHHVMPTNPNPDRARRAAAPSAAVVVRNEESDSEEEAIIAAQRTARGGAPAVAVAVLLVAEPPGSSPRSLVTLQSSSCLLGDHHSYAESNDVGMHTFLILFRPLGLCF